MEPAREPPWAEHEKVYLLAEILKASLPSHVLLSLIRDAQIQPPWEQIALPRDRSLRSCQLAYHDISATHVHAAPVDYRHRPHLPAPMASYPGPDMSKKRPHQPEATTPMGGRLIQPRPPHAYPGDFVSGPTPYALSPVTEPANKKKRGRPTKAESESRREAALAQGLPYPPPRKSRQSLTSVDLQSGDALRPGASPPGSAPLGPMGSMTPQQTQQPEPHSESSSGKKRRGKPTPLELFSEKAHRGTSDIESPLAYGLGTGDPSRSSQAYSSFTPISAPLPSADPRDVRMEGVEESQPRHTPPHSFKDTVGI